MVADASFTSDRGPIFLSDWTLDSAIVVTHFQDNKHYLASLVPGPTRGPYKINPPTHCEFVPQSAPRDAHMTRVR